MKNAIAVLLAVIMGLCLISCADTEVTDGPPVSTERKEVVTRTSKGMPMIVAQEVSGVRPFFEDGFFAYDSQHVLYAVLGSDRDDLSGGDEIYVEYSGLTEPQTSGDHGGSGTYTPTYEMQAKEVLTKEEKELRDVADEAVMEEYGITDLSPYHTWIYVHERATEVMYTLCIHGYDTHEKYWVSFTPGTKEVEGVDGAYGEYACFLGVATEKAVREAEEKLQEKGDGAYWLSIDEDGYLCLNLEVIRHLEKDEMSGILGEDHEHLFFKERICKKPE